MPSHSAAKNVFHPEKISQAISFANEEKNHMIKEETQLNKMRETSNAVHVRMWLEMTFGNVKNVEKSVCLEMCMNFK